jgi:hypothetical protein
MCNACNNQCCGSDQFEGCGCDNCDEPDCWSRCQGCELPETDCVCPGEYDDDFGVND